MSEPSTAPNPIVFVTALGWVLIFFTSFGGLTSLMQNVMVWFVFPALDQQMDQTQPMPDAVFLGFRILATFMLCVCIFLFYAAWSFIKRRNWARKTFVVCFVLGVIWTGLVVAFFGLGVGVFGFGPRPPSATGIPSSMDSAFRVMAITFGVMATAMCVLLVWLIRRLRSPEVRAQFQPPPLSAESPHGEL